ncbi:MAG: thioredoxin domain-containing protein [Betaproteobacteria bacterium]|nr:thioredoxin domain-containing protein [Betaproteobacteria bacterium]PWB66471.1 MAG: thioredoxin domain-containing protein [Betaproteobacteria bacterium]
MKNRLAEETSPYLQQHADNPVDWHPWGEEALRAARESGKPILLSVGYSACHWCHVMAHESFEDPEVAAVMNELFVNVKVDREERPDIDQVYQLAQQMLTQRPGGWPLTMFLTPDQVPFFGGTYFPKEARYGLPGFVDLMRRVRAWHDEKRGDLEAQGGELVAALARMQPRSGAHPSEFSPAPLAEAIATHEGNFDREHGGFGRAPKFPHPDAIDTCLRHHARTGDARALEMATVTLARMAQGGLFDQLGGGFARYSTDDEWAIPHFEKMLYDNGQLIRLYADAWAITGEALFARTVEETAAWVMREMQSPEGGYYSSLDADSEGEEGKYYVWTRDEVHAALSPEERAVAIPHYGFDRAPNFEGRAWNPVVARPLRDVAASLAIGEDEAARRLAAARSGLLAVRERRVRPGRDDKILTSWNALMIGGMARAARVFGRDDWLASARRALAFVGSTMWDGERLLATHKDGKSHLNAYLDDHAFLLAALLEVLQADFREDDLAWAEALGDALLERFRDDAAGGFFFTSHDHERLIQRPKPGHDNATPSGNGVAAWALGRLACLSGETRFQAAAEGTLALFWPALERSPAGFGSLLMALEETLSPPTTVIVNGPEAGFGPWREALRRDYLPDTLALFVPGGGRSLPPPLAKPAGPAVNAWVCRGVTCLAPITHPGQLRETLKAPKIVGSAPNQTVPLKEIPE